VGTQSKARVRQNCVNCLGNIPADSRMQRAPVSFILKLLRDRSSLITTPVRSSNPTLGPD
jgi:hypothetical protein